MEQPSDRMIQRYRNDVVYHNMAYAFLETIKRRGHMTQADLQECFDLACIMDARRVRDETKVGPERDLPAVSYGDGLTP